MPKFIYSAKSPPKIWQFLLNTYIYGGDFAKILKKIWVEATLYLPTLRNIRSRLNEWLIDSYVHNSHITLIVFVKKLGNSSYSYHISVAWKKHSITGNDRKKTNEEEVEKWEIAKNRKHMFLWHFSSIIGYLLLHWHIMHNEEDSFLFLFIPNCFFAVFYRLKWKILYSYHFL